MWCLSLLLPAAAAACTADLDCSLNGKCSSSACVCDKPWSGPSCGELKYKITPAGAKNLYHTSDPRNTWNGPIVTAPDGKYHIFDPLYDKGSLGGPPRVMHGVADNITGPWDWHSQKDACTKCGENPAFVVYEVESSNGRGGFRTATVYSLWVGGKILTSSSLDGPFTHEGQTYPGGNPAPIFRKTCTEDGATCSTAFYMTNQKTTQVWMSANLGLNWTQFAEIDHSAVAADWMIEDPFMWVDHRDNWHIINHAYDNHEWKKCGNSTLSAHFFSPDGKSWHTLNTRPYDHTVHYDDGTVHTYTTLERPNLHFDASGQLTHINLAADLVTGDEGCGDRSTKHSHFGHIPCDNCKWADHAGTTLIALDV